MHVSYHLEASLLLKGNSFSSFCSGMGTVEHIMLWIARMLPLCGLGLSAFAPASACDGAPATESEHTQAKQIQMHLAIEP